MNQALSKAPARELGLKAPPLTGNAAQRLIHLSPKGLGPHGCICGVPVNLTHQQVRDGYRRLAYAPVGP